MTSSTEAECCALTIVGKENQWQRQIYEALTGKMPEETLIHCDNTATIALITAGVTKRTRHFDIEWFKFQDLVENREIKVQWVQTDENLADFFTKKLAPDKFTYFCNRLMGYSVSPACVRRLVTTVKSANSDISLQTQMPAQHRPQDYLINFTSLSVICMRVVEVTHTTHGGITSLQLQFVNS